MLEGYWHGKTRGLGGTPVLVPLRHRHKSHVEWPSIKPRSPAIRGQHQSVRPSTSRWPLLCTSDHHPLLECYSNRILCFRYIQHNRVCPLSQAVGRFVQVSLLLLGVISNRTENGETRGRTSACGRRKGVCFIELPFSVVVCCNMWRYGTVFWQAGLWSRSHTNRLSCCQLLQCSARWVGIWVVEFICISKNLFHDLLQFAVCQ
jgi:hypothetical protein